MKNKTRPPLFLHGWVLTALCTRRAPSPPPDPRSGTDRLLTPGEGVDAEPLEVEVPVKSITMYSHPSAKLRGFWLISKHAE
jgi:hypothetical protein